MAVRAFVAPLEPSGSIDAAQASYQEEDPLALGRLLHGRVQKRLLKDHPGTQAEVPVQALLARPGFSCRVRGRMDALLPGDPEVVEEIKTGFRPAAILQALREDPVHPFALQARMYAWIRWRQTGAPPACRLRIIGLLDEEEVVQELPWDPPAFTRWVEGRLEELHRAFLRAQARAAERRELASRLPFPFPSPRPGQRELSHRVAQALAQGRRLLLQAPTGLGKTAGVLYPALIHALETDRKVFYVTPRNSQHQVAEDCVARLGEEVRSVTIRAKERVCPQEQVDCRPEVCPRALLYYDRLKDSGILESLAAQGCATPERILRAADEHQLCPFELSLDAARQADVVIGDYNYVFSPNAALARFFGSPEDSARQVVLVDEAHNLPARAADWFSPSLDMDLIRELRKRKLPGPRARGMKAKVNTQARRCLQVLEALEGPHRMLDLDPQPFFGEEHRLGKLLATAAAAGQELPPAHPLVELHRSWSAFCAVLRLRGEEHGISWIPPGRLQITCADASSHLALTMGAVADAVLFSGTLKPFAFHRRLSGLQDLETDTAEVPSPFPAEHRRILVVPQVSTLYRRREREVPRIAQFLQRVLPLRRGNYFVFFPSFELLEKTLPHLDLPGFRLLAQPRRATGTQLQELMDALRQDRGVVVLAVQGGSLSEGVDLPGEALIGCVVVGPPLPPYDLEREHIRQHFQKTCGSGQQFAYAYPAAAKAIQAAGRVIRTPGDRGLLIFLDGRFLEPDFLACFPQDWRQGPWVSTSILADVAAFWGEAGAPQGRE
jgi:DNA excision repair protein ERCC-2